MKIGSLLVVWVILTWGGTPAARGQVAPLAELEARAHADSNDPVALYELARAYLRLRRIYEARALLETAVRIDGEYPAAYTLLGQLEKAQAAPITPVMERSADGRIRVVGIRADPSLDSAARLFRRSVLLDPMQEIYPPNPQQLPPSERSTLWHGLQEFWSTRFGSAAGAFETAILKADRKHKPPPPLALWYHALSEVGIQHLDSAIEDVERLLDRAMRDSTVFADYASRSVSYALAYLHQQAGHFQEAERLYRQLIEQDLSLDLAHLQLARIYEVEERWPEAVQERREALAIASNDPALLYDLGATLLESGQPGEAADTLRQVVAENPRNARAYYMLGIADGRLRQFQAARDAYDRFLQLAPSRYEDMIADAKARRAHLP